LLLPAITTVTFFPSSGKNCAHLLVVIDVCDPLSVPLEALPHIQVPFDAVDAVRVVVVPEVQLDRKPETDDTKFQAQNSTNSTSTRYRFWKQIAARTLVASLSTGRWAP